MPDVAALKDHARRLWASGDYPAVARTNAGAGEPTARRAGAAPGVRLLDVAAGDGNVAIPAALAGADVLAVDLTPELLAAGERRARAAGAPGIEWREGDAEDLPVEDGSFDAVTSNFGVVFVPRHELAARELARAVRPGGVVVVTAWTTEGINGQIFGALGRFLPPPRGVGTPVQWGDEAYGRALLQGAGLEVEVERDAVRSWFGSVGGMTEFFRTTFTPLVANRGRLEAERRWEDAIAALVAIYEPAVRPAPGGEGIEVQAPYLRYVGRRPGRR